MLHLKGDKAYLARPRCTLPRSQLTSSARDTRVMLTMVTRPYLLKLGCPGVCEDGAALAVGGPEPVPLAAAAMTESTGELQTLVFAVEFERWRVGRSW